MCSETGSLFQESDSGSLSKRLLVAPLEHVGIPNLFGNTPPPGDLRQPASESLIQVGSQRPFLTSNMAGIGGQIKTENADFVVEEIPLYRPAGHGEHTYITLRKDGLSTFEAVQQIARALGIESAAVGYAGLKDAHAVTVQTISVGNVPLKAVHRLALPGIHILEAARHTNKLKIGHLRGNRFTIRVRGVAPDALPQARRILDVLTQHGVPNWFGEQRFGLRGDTHQLGRALVLGDDASLVQQLVGRPHPAETPRVQYARWCYEEGRLADALEAWPHAMSLERRVLQSLIAHPHDVARAARAVPFKMRDFFISAYQSDLFNRLLADRLSALGRLQEGDLAWLHDRGAVFLVQDPHTEQPRADRLEISPSGPLYGYKLTWAQGRPGEMEQQVWNQEGLTVEHWRRIQVKGARRPLRFPLQNVHVWYDEGVMVSFELPAGCYATVVLAELTKTSSPALSTT